MKILHLIPSLGSGGAERQLVTLVLSADPKIKHIVCAISDSEIFGGELRAGDARVVDLQISGKRPIIRSAIEFRKLIEAEQPDIIHTWLYNANIAARLAVLSGCRMPLITSLQAADYEPYAAIAGNWNKNKVLLLKTLDKVSALLTKPWFVPCSQFVKGSYERHFGLPAARTRVIYNSVDAAALHASPQDVERLRSELSLPRNALVYSNVGRLDTLKNHSTLIKAFDLLRSGVENAYLLIAGAGPLKSDLEAEVTHLGLDERVILLGRRSDIGTILSLSDIFVFPSLFEGLPVAVAEAMTKSLPCIVSRLPVFQEIIDDRKTGIMVDPMSVEELATAMMDLGRDPELRKEIGRNAYAFANSELNSRVTAEEWKHLYLKVLSSRARR